MEEVPLLLLLSALSVAEKPIMTPCWKLFLCLALHCFCYYIYIMACLRGPCPSAWKWKYYLLSHVWLFVTPWTSSLPGSSVHRILQARILEWVAISFSRGSSWPRDWTWISCIEGRFFYLLNPQWSPAPLPECKLECFCSAHREIIWPIPSTNTYSKKKRLTHPSKGWPFPEIFWKTEGPFTLLPHCLSLPFTLVPTTSPPLFCLLTSVPHWFSVPDFVKEPGIQTLTRWLLWDSSLPSFQLASFLNKVVFLASTPHLLDSLVCHMVRRVSLDSAVWALVAIPEPGQSKHERSLHCLLQLIQYALLIPCPFPYPCPCHIHFKASDNKSFTHFIEMS